MTFNNNLLIGISALIVAVSIAFYSFFYLPIAGQSELKLAEQQRAADKEAKTERVAELKSCLAEAESKYSSFWNAECKANKLEDSCRLPADSALTVEEFKTDEKNLCFKLYD